MSDDPILDALLNSIAPPDESKWIKVCIYGPPGVGKTILAATAPRPMFLDVENGYVSVHNHPELLAASKRMRFMGVKAVERLAERLQHFPDNETVVIDTMTALQDRALKEITISQFKKNPNLREDAYTPEGKDYQRNTELLKHIISLFRDADKHVIFLCHDKEDKDDTTGKVFWRPQLTPKLAGKLEADCSLVGHMTATGKGTEESPYVRSLQIQPTPSVHAKSRLSPLLPAVIKNPHFDMFLNPQNYFESEQNK